MSKTIVLPLADGLQSQSHYQKAKLEESRGFEQVGSIMKRMLVNLARHGDMLYGEVLPRRTTHKPDTQNKG